MRTAPDALSEPREPEDDAAGWQFVRWVLVSMLVVLVGVGGFNAWVDPTGTLGTGLVDPVAELPRDRKAKVSLLERAEDPELVVLGSSRSKRLEPELLESGEPDGVNAAVVGSDMLEQHVFTTWLAERTKRGHPFPHLVVGVDVEQWRDRSLRETGLLAVQELAPIARAEARGGSSITALGSRVPELMLSWAATRTSIDALREREASASQAEDAAENEESVTRTRDVDEFRADGVPRDHAKWLSAKGRAYLRRGLPDELEATTEEYRGRYGDIAEDAVRYFEDLVATANEQGDTPLVFLTPMHPAMADDMEDEGRPDRLERVRELLQAAEDDGSIVFVDCSACLDRRADNWVDGVHPSAVGARRLAAALRQGAALLART